MPNFELLVDGEGYATKGQENGLRAVIDELSQVKAALSQIQNTLSSMQGKMDNISVGKIVLASTS